MVFREKERTGRFDLEAIEWSTRDMMRDFGGHLIEKMLDCVNDHRGARIPCACGGSALFSGYRSKKIQTVLSEMTLSRAYYLCQRCGRGQVPLDRELDIENTSFSPGARRMICRMGARESFRDASDDLLELAGLSVNPKAIERVSETVGEQMQKAELDRQEAIMTGNLVPAVKPVPVLYIAVDGTGVPVIPSETEGRKGKQPDGSAKTREVKLGCVFTQTSIDENGRPLRDPLSTSYTGSIENSDEFGRRIYSEAISRGLDRAKKTVVLGDGAPWVWNLADEHFPHSVQIVDLYHAREHLSILAKSVFPDSDPLKSSWLNDSLSLLDQGDVESLIEKIRSLRPDHLDQEKFILQTAGYFSNNKNRMRYASFKSQNLFVGSGVVEAGCKSVIGQRLKLSGMRWSLYGANSIIALRCSLLSHKWTNFWDSRASA